MSRHQFSSGTTGRKRERGTHSSARSSCAMRSSDETRSTLRARTFSRTLLLARKIFLPSCRIERWRASAFRRRARLVGGGGRDAPTRSGPREADERRRRRRPGATSSSYRRRRPRRASPPCTRAGSRCACGGSSGPDVRSRRSSPAARRRSRTPRCRCRRPRAPRACRSSSAGRLRGRNLRASGESAGLEGTARGGRTYVGERVEHDGRVCGRSRRLSVRSA